ncbi:MAG: multidrug efflux RND transporter permease subunit [Gemmataceae bacterium]|nr:multidrug efflux RND transporter permease subunit [Gemmataceae bacterium]
MFSRYFIDRPIFASVLSILITLAGGIAVFSLPLSMYPRITPPTVQVDCNFPGASADVVQQSIAVPIEQQVNGVEGMLYMSSQCTNDGSYNLSVTFDPSVDLNLAQVLVQNRVNLALPSLPDSVKQTGVMTRKKSPDILMTVNVFSPDLRHDQLYLSNYALLQIRDEIARISGVGDISVLGQRDYSMRIWVDPERLAYLSITAGDVAGAIRDQNREATPGQIGQEPMALGQDFQVPLKALGRLSSIEQFKEIIIKSTPDGRIVRLKDVARITLSAKNEQMSCNVDRRPSVGLAIFQLPDANALDTADHIIAKMNELKNSFPEGVDYQISYDTTPFTRESIREVFKTLIDSVLLVALVVILFLQNWRSAIIPLVAVPVAIVGTFAVMAVLGFSLNTLTLFGLVLAIGIVVDDAIVVVEAVEHHIELGLSPREATIRAMEQVSGPVIAVGLVLSAVFVPCAFMSGLTGQFFRQFALTIAVSTVISAFNSLTLSPALAAILLKPRAKGAYVGLPAVVFTGLGVWGATHLRLPIASWCEANLDIDYRDLLAWGILPIGAGVGWLLASPCNAGLAWWFAGFNRAFAWSTNAYTHIVRWALRGCVLMLLLYVGLLGLTWHTFNALPRGFIPNQDMGYFMVNVQLPDAAAMERTRAVMDRAQKIVHDAPGVTHSSALAGSSLLLNAVGSNFGSLFVMLDDFSKRQGTEFYSETIIANLRTRFNKEIPEAQIAVFGPPPIRGVGRAGGFKLMIKDLADQQPRALQGRADNMVELGNTMVLDDTGLPIDLTGKQREAGSLSGRSALTGLISPFRANVPTFFVDVNRTQAMAMEVPLKDTFETMQIYLGSMYVNDFNLYGRTWQVILQADAPFRDKIDDVRRLQVRNNAGEMVPLGALCSINEVNGPLVLTRHNQKPAAAISGNAARGVSSLQAIRYMEKLAKDNLPNNMDYEWTELAFLEVRAGNTGMIIFLFAVVMVFLVLAAQYESWSLPLAVILVVPMCILCALAGVAIGKQDINIFTQIGFVVLVGLASKNAILIVEFAKHLRESGSDRMSATIDACRLRLRPIVMTSMAFILGVVPLLIARGAGAEMRRTLGTAVFSGMLGVTLFGLLLTPVFFYVVDKLGSNRAFASPEARTTQAILLYFAGFLLLVAGMFFVHAIGFATLACVWLAWATYRLTRWRGV